MKKKLLLSFILILFTFCLVGCDSNSVEVNELLSALQKEKIVDQNLKQVSTVTKMNVGIHITTKTYYIYENEDSKLIAINYSKSSSSKNDYDYYIEIYNDVTVDDNPEYLEEDSSPEVYYTYDNDKKTVKNKYILNDRTDYKVTKSKFLFFKTKYKFEKIK